MADLTLLIAFAAGIVSFASPCVLPLVPAYLAHLAGVTVSSAQQGVAGAEAASNARLKILINSALFVLGFASLFALLGVLLTTVLAYASVTLQRWLARVGGVLIVLFGLHLLGAFRLGVLEREHSLDLRGFKPSYAMSFLFGATFAVGWTPCIGPVLGSILGLAASAPASAFALLLAFALGLGLPFLLVGAFTSQASRLIARAGPWLRWFNIVVGAALVALGILVFFGLIHRLMVFPVAWF